MIIDNREQLISYIQSILNIAYLYKILLTAHAHMIKLVVKEILSIEQHGHYQLNQFRLLINMKSVAGFYRGECACADDKACIPVRGHM